MSELRPFIFQSAESKLTHFLKQEDTWLARGIRLINNQEGDDWRNSEFKDRWDKLEAGAILALAGLPMMLIWGLAYLQSPMGYPIYRQKRMSKEGKEVTVLKFRSLRDGSDATPNGGDYLTTSPESDSRATRLGRILRSIELDELPQLFNVLRGEMALTDLRIVPKEEVERLRDTAMKGRDWYKAYVSGRPGAFSLFSSFARNRKNIDGRPNFDLLQARRASLGLDLLIQYKWAMRCIRKIEQKILRDGREQVI